MGTWIIRIIAYGKLFLEPAEVVVSGNWRTGRNSFFAAELGPGDDVVRSGRQGELDACVVIRLDGGGEVEHRELNVSRPMAALPVISRGVKCAAYDRVFGGLFAVAVAENQNGWWELGLSWALRDLW